MGSVIANHDFQSLQRKIEFIHIFSSNISLLTWVILSVLLQFPFKSCFYLLVQGYSLNPKLLPFGAKCDYSSSLPVNLLVLFFF